MPPVFAIRCEVLSALAFAQIFAASGQQIRGMTRKGKEFFKVITNLTEVIKSMFVEDTKIWTSKLLFRCVAAFTTP